MRERGTERANGQQPGRISYTCVCRFAGTRDATRAYIHPAWDTLFHTPPDREARKVEERCPRKFIHYTLQKFLSLKPGQIELRMIELTGKLIFRKRIRFAIYRVSFPLQTLNVRVLIFCVGDKLFFVPAGLNRSRTCLFGTELIVLLVTLYASLITQEVMWLEPVQILIHLKSDSIFQNNLSFRLSIRFRYNIQAWTSIEGYMNIFVCDECSIECGKYIIGSTYKDL